MIAVATAKLPMKIRLLNWHWIAMSIVIVSVFAQADAPVDGVTAAQRTLEQTRRELQEQGFKTDLTNFDFSTSPELQAWEVILISTVTNRHVTHFLDHPDLMEPTDSNKVIVVWEQNSLRRQSPSWPDASYELTWEDFRQAINQREPQIDAACAAMLSGPIQFDLDASEGNYMKLPHLALLKDLTQTLNDRAMLALHDGNRAAAWTNLMAATRLVTAWNPEPAEVSHRLRFDDAKLVFKATWQVLQTNCWTDDQLLRLQREWEQADFLSRLPEIPAFQRASDFQLLIAMRRHPKCPRKMFMKMNSSCCSFIATAKSNFAMRCTPAPGCKCAKCPASPMQFSLNSSITRGDVSK